eukprot:scaffold218899_cov24-Tisochrysis_lutea.AAC.3
MRTDHVHLCLERAGRRVGQAIDLHGDALYKRAGRPHTHAVREGREDDRLIEDDPKVDEVAEPAHHIEGEGDEQLDRVGVLPHQSGPRAGVARVG